MPSAPKKLLLAAPRGYCAGVDRAVQTVERALDLYGAPVYVRKEIVHNKHVVEQLRARGAIFVEEETEVPEGKTVVYSAHGVAPIVHANSDSLGHRTPDGGALRPGAGDRVEELVELEPAGRDRARPRRGVAPDRQRGPGTRGVARGQADRRHHLGRQRARGAGAAPGPVLPRPRH